MSADDLVNGLTQGLFITIAGVTLVHAVRRPRRATIDIALFFGAFALIFLGSWITDHVDTFDHQAVTTALIILLVALPYLLLRIVADFITVSPRFQRAAGLLLALLAVAVAVAGSGEELPDWLVLGIGAYFVGLGVYASWEFGRGARRARGVTARRLYAAAFGSMFIGLVILVVVIRAVASSIDSIATDVVVRALTLLSGLSYFIAFSPPRILRRAWQEPELRELLARVAVLPRMPNMPMIVRALEDGAAATLGAPHAAIVLWDAERQVLRAEQDGVTFEGPPGVGIGGRAFAEQRPIFSENAPRDDPEHAEGYRAYGAVAILAAPITAGDRSLGVLTVYSPRPPIFADDDLQLVQLLADQAAIILESRSLIDEATLVQARAEATRLRDDFLVAAAHDLRTPLTAAIARAQFIERRGRNKPDVPINPADIQLVVTDLNRLSALMNELLDAARAEHGQLLENRQAIDLVALVRDARQRRDWSLHRFVLDAPHPVEAAVDPARMTQVIDNLLENAIKYSPEGGDVRVTVWADDAQACLSVSDSGIGIPPADLPHIFDRFHRGRNVETPSFAGMGLGLYICQSIVEQHGGTIGAHSTVSEGTTFEIRLPVVGSTAS